MIISSFIANLTELILFARMIKLRCTLDSEIKIPARTIEVPWLANRVVPPTVYD